jgi:hypothetical protein
MNEPAGARQSWNVDALTDHTICGDVERQEFSSEIGFDAVV